MHIAKHEAYYQKFTTNFRDIYSGLQSKNTSLYTSKLKLHTSRRRRRGSSTTSLIRRKKNTASLPSISLWSYVNARYIIGLGTMLPSTTIGRLMIECIPKIADCKTKREKIELLLRIFFYEKITTQSLQYKETHYLVLEFLKTH